jgi:hypothetical protein
VAWVGHRAQPTALASDSEALAALRAPTMAQRDASRATQRALVATSSRPVEGVVVPPMAYDLVQTQAAGAELEMAGMEQKAACQTQQAVQGAAQEADRWEVEQAAGPLVRRLRAQVPFGASVLLPQCACRK